MAVAAIDRLGYRLNWWDSNPLDPSTFFAHPSSFTCQLGGSGGDACTSLLACWLALFAIFLSFQFGLHHRCCGNGNKELRAGEQHHHHYYYDHNHTINNSVGRPHGARGVYDPQMSDRAPLLANDERR
jgi:hypothetical protein